MTEDRMMVAKAVFEGKLSEDYLSQDEVDEMFQLVAEAVFRKDMEEASARGCNVFDGFEDDLVH